jgi:hypothetical protein
VGRGLALNPKENLSMKKLIAAFGLAAGLAGAAQAYTITPLNVGPHEVDTSFSSASMLSVDYGFKNHGSVALQIGVEASDGPVLAFNALARNLIGLGLPYLVLELDGTQFASLGSAQGSFGSVATVSGGPSEVTIALAPAEFFQVTVGDWFLDGSGVDFGIDLAGLAGSSFTLTATAAVPEPETYALMLGGLALVAAMRRRRRD